eukprot:maker-scaffold_1-snap-gene-25.2-mRNA-1 protein AED:0.00 eAED:0.00 QI:99/1/1/1/1/1/3/171/228
MEVICANNLYVENIPSAWCEVDLEKLFSPFGHIQRVLILRNRKGESKGKGFVNFVLEKEASSVLEHMKQMDTKSPSLGGNDEKLKVLKLSLARLQTKSSPRFRARSSTSGSIDRKLGYPGNNTLKAAPVPVVDSASKMIGRGRAQTLPRLDSTYSRGWNFGNSNVADVTKAYPVYVPATNQGQNQWMPQTQMMQNGYLTYVNHQPASFMGYGFLSNPSFMYGQMGYGA